MAGLTINPTGNDRIKYLNSTHVFMMDWLIVNPGRTLKELAEIIGYDRAWVSQVVNSDMFQAMYHQRMQECGQDSMDERAAKLKAGAIEAVDAIRERLAGRTLPSGAVEPPSERFIIDAAKTLLPAAGYAAPSVSKPEAQKHLHLHVDGETLQRSREKMRARFGTLVPEPPQLDASEPSETEDERIERAFEQMDLFEEVA